VLLLGVVIVPVRIIAVLDFCFFCCCSSGCGGGGGGNNGGSPPPMRISLH
jgi:hypothetical protein